jgi:hypothetical protein
MNWTICRSIILAGNDNPPHSDSYADYSLSNRSHGMKFISAYHHPALGDRFVSFVSPKSKWTTFICTWNCNNPVVTSTRRHWYRCVIPITTYVMRVRTTAVLSITQLLWLIPTLTARTMRSLKDNISLVPIPLISLDAMTPPNWSTGCFACGTTSGFVIYNVEPFRETFRRTFTSGGELMQRI